VVAELADRVAVMYAGKVVEEAPARELFADPRHPYTRGLLACIPHPGSKSRLPAIEGMVPHPAHLPGGCRFRTRCPLAQEVCRGGEPELAGRGGHRAACFLAPEREA
jgi:oligopeptide/dipeptide ABC transporter ATP-binding protein